MTDLGQLIAKLEALSEREDEAWVYVRLGDIRALLRALQAQQETSEDE